MSQYLLVELSMHVIVFDADFLRDGREVLRDVEQSYAPVSVPYPALPYHTLLRYLPLVSTATAKQRE